MKILKFKENKDGSVTMNYVLTEKERAIIKQVSGAKKLTHKIINETILKAITEYAEKLE